ncbi:hypothetical protein, partial [Chitinophaga oryziterrae]|uniref:hypothetical protein n=1 Tax=Chitinophaga oryziterrae TaxID=1031224 RepID=UPI0031DC2E66
CKNLLQSCKAGFFLEMCPDGSPTGRLFVFSIIAFYFISISYSILSWFDQELINQVPVTELLPRPIGNRPSE